MQLTLDLPATEPTLTLVTRCHLCGVGWAVPVDGPPGAPWQPAMLWGYIALKHHLAEHHPDDPLAPTQGGTHAPDPDDDPAP